MPPKRPRKLRKQQKDAYDYNPLQAALRDPHLAAQGFDVASLAAEQRQKKIDKAEKNAKYVEMKTTKKEHAKLLFSYQQTLREIKICLTQLGAKNLSSLATLHGQLQGSCLPASCVEAFAAAMTDPDSQVMFVPKVAMELVQRLQKDVKTMLHDAQQEHNAIGNDVCMASNLKLKKSYKKKGKGSSKSYVDQK